MTSSASPDRLLAVYLNDHFAGATLGMELARRLRSSNENDAILSRPLEEICAEIEADRATLEQLMDQLGIHRGRVKPAAAWAGEKLGRLKLNGQLHGYSPLSGLVELELLYIGITGKMRMWKALQHTLGEGVGEFDFRQLSERAARQLGRVEELHLSAAALALPSSNPSRS
ncbi:MAG TPA: hypothetical protein VN756_09995 [Solirubrobacterales bacterium]|nr:hypothetical protein [Solirubrobacterales bacterium]